MDGRELGREPAALVRNAGSEKQVKKAELKQNLRERQEQDDLREILALPAGRRFVARLLAEAKVHQDIWRPSAEIHRLAGAQAFGHWLMRQCVMSDHKTTVEMMVEAYEKEMGV